MLPFSKLQQLTVLLSSFSSAQLPCSKSWEHWCWLMSISTHWTIFQMIYFRAYKLQVLSCNLVLLQAYLKMSQALLQTTWNKCAGGCEERSLSNTTQQPTAKLLKHKILSAEKQSKCLKVTKIISANLIFDSLEVLSVLKALCQNF